MLFCRMNKLFQIKTYILNVYKHFRLFEKKKFLSDVYQQYDRGENIQKFTGNRTSQY